MKQQSTFEYLRHGQTPFFRLPAVTDSFSSGVALLGVPYDGGTTYQPGARLAPFHVRRVSAFFQSYHPHHKISVFDEIEAYDAGNITAPPFNDEHARGAVQGMVSQVVQAGGIPFLLGGDHSIALPALRSVVSRHGPVALVHVDAHLDSSPAESWGADFHHGTPIRHALTEGLIEKGLLFQLGIRASEADEHDRDLVMQHDAMVLSPDELCANLHGTMAQIRERIGDRPTYISFDIDAVDPAFAPGTGTPVAGGFTSREAIALLRELRGANIVGMDLVEVAPGLDVGDATSILAAQLLYEGLALVALHQKHS
jgi:agmatinase